MSYDSSKVLCFTCGWKVKDLTKHMLRYHARGKDKVAINSNEELVSFENLSDEDKKHFADGWLEKENG